MKGERKLRLVPPPTDRDEATLSEDERAEAAALAEQLRAAYAPQPIDGADLEAILSRALGDDDAAPTRVEREAADRLRMDLEGPAPRAEGALFSALRLAASPPSLAPEKNEALIASALSRAWQARRAARRIAPVTMAALASITAIAAGVALYIGHAPPRGDAAALIRARSADDLFDAATPFPRTGEESARVDRIASARAGDLRRNRFASWGLR